MKCKHCKYIRKDIKAGMFYCAYHGAYIDNKLINKDIGCASEYGD